MSDNGPELHLFLIWLNARNRQEEIIKDIVTQAYASEYNWYATRCYAGQHARATANTNPDAGLWVVGQQ